EAMVFVHGWCCNHTYFASQFQRFSEDFRVIAVDLRGHGRSDKPEETYTIQGFADDVAWMCESLGVASAILVGHSMGGLITLILAASHPSLVRGAVFVDA